MNKADTLALFAQGKEAWNAWAERMLAERKALEEKGEWREFDREGASQAWRDAARADFRGHKFAEPANFSGYVFPDEANFGPVKGKDATGKSVHISVRFEMPAFFGGAIFSGFASFGGAIFADTAYFTESRFLGVTGFGEATFSEDVGFDKAIFARGAAFIETMFLRDARFNDSAFQETVRFKKSKFSKIAWFNRATFAEHAQFGGATFLEDARFGNARFLNDAWFKNVTFAGEARFGKATFSGNTGFGEATFSGNAEWNLARFESLTIFEKARFEKAASFAAMNGEGSFSLRGASFREAPDFEQAHFSEAPMLQDSHFPTKPQPGESNRWRALKRLAMQGHDHEREQLFFANELISLRGETDWLWPRLQQGKLVWQNGARYWLGLFYQWFSDFGRSMVRPVVWWCGFTALFALIYLGQHFPNKNVQPYAPKLNVWAASNFAPPLKCASGEASNPLDSAIFLAIHKGSVAGLGDSEKLAQSYACLYGEEQSAPASRRQIIPDFVAFMGFAQTILSAPLIFLFLLSVRNHFRIK